MNDTHRESPIMVILTTALAPLIWGSTYLVTTELLPPSHPMSRQRGHSRVQASSSNPAGSTRNIAAVKGWLLVLSILNIAFFQAMLFVSAYRLPGGLAAILNSTQTLMVLVLT